MNARQATPPQWPATDRPARPAVFIDKDGTLVENVPYNADPALLRFMPAALETLAALAAAGYALVVVTNQSGLALGYFSRVEFARLQTVLQQRLRDEAGIELTDFVVCPHAAGPDGRPACLCRKPAPGMLQRASRMHGLNLSRSWMVGDTLDDVEAGRSAGCRAVLLDSGGETLWRRSPLRTPQAICSDWDEVAHIILRAQFGAGFAGGALEPGADGQAPVGTDLAATSALARPQAVADTGSAGGTAHAGPQLPCPSAIAAP